MVARAVSEQPAAFRHFDWISRKNGAAAEMPSAFKISRGTFGVAANDSEIEEEPGEFFLGL